MDEHGGHGRGDGSASTLTSCRTEAYHFQAMTEDTPRWNRRPTQRFPENEPSVSTNTPCAVGIDIGALYLKIAAVDAAGDMISAKAVPHFGHPEQTLRESLPAFPSNSSLCVGLTGSLAESIAEQTGIKLTDLTQARMEAARTLAPDARNIIDIGGSSVTLIRLSRGGGLEGLSRNSLCAAGTGSFLDEQALRLGISYDDLSSFPRVEDPPPIASRCAVFAKSDLVHHQQAGRTRAECWSGLCRSTVQSFLGTLLQGRPLEGPSVVIGGVARNPEVIRRLKEIYGDDIRIPESPQSAAALGAALLAQTEINPESLLEVAENRCRPESQTLATRPPLSLKRSTHPSWEVEESFLDDMGNEIRVTRLPSGRISCWLGIDIGSTSTKILAADREGAVLCDIYRKTGGDPIGATLKLFRAMQNLAARRQAELEVLGCVTTGSGRKMVGMVIGADAAVNEISCHVRGAMHVDPTIDTIFEIGGQDSKYMRTVGGRIRDAALNYVCAAGTGSFVEEQARKLGFAVEDVGPAVMDIAPPHTSDRCTVFMEQDVNRLLRAGRTREEAMAAVMYSVAQNYLNKIVGRRSRSNKKLFFQGATARNSGLVAAFENLLDAEIVVSPYAHVMGSWGAALAAREAMENKGRKSGFKGLDLSDRKIELRTERCSHCANFCEITFSRVDGDSEEASWGYMCGREADAGKKRRLHAYRFFEIREKLLAEAGKSDVPAGAPAVAIPLALIMHSSLPFWRRLMNELGCRVVLPPTGGVDTKFQTAETLGSDFCHPVKAALNHARWAFEKTGADFVLIPHAISNRPNAFTSNAFFCPYVQVYPSLVQTSLRIRGKSTSQLLAPIMDLRWKKKRIAAEIFEKIARPLGKTRKDAERALQAGLAAQAEFEAACAGEGERALREISSEDRPAVMILGRPYNTCDPSVNLGLAMKIAERGITVIPLDLLPFDPEELGPEFENLYWSYSQRIVHAMKIHTRNPRLFPVYFTNFNCGPDSFIETYAERLAGDKPLLILGLDDHDADTGYITRIEAFLDVIRNSPGAGKPSGIHVPRTRIEEFRRRTIWIPNIHPVGAVLGAAAFRSMGYNAQTLPLETEESFEVGRSLTSGNECLPNVVTIGALVAKLRETGADPKTQAFMMATTAGPCRFGQYALKHRLILDSLGYRDIAILSPSSQNSYQGLPESLRRKTWDILVASDILMKLRCKIKPYERIPGETDRVLSREIERLVDTIERGGNFLREWKNAVSALGGIPHDRTKKKPLVGIVGEIYVRCNAFTNDRVIEAVEHGGGEAWLSPFSEWFLYTAYLQKWKAKEDLRSRVHQVASLLKNRYLRMVEHKYAKRAEPWIKDRMEPPIESIVTAGADYLPKHFQGEAILSLGRALKFVDGGADLVVNCAPFGCMPGIITAAIFQEIQSRHGVPVVTMFYDGEGDLNRIIGVHLAQYGSRKGWDREHS